MRIPGTKGAFIAAAALAFVALSFGAKGAAAQAIDDPEAAAEIAAVAVAETSDGPYERGTVLRVADEGEEEVAEGYFQRYRTIEVRIDAGERKGETVRITQYGDAYASHGRDYEPGDKVIVSSGEYGGEREYYVQDRYRLPVLAWFFVLFLALAVAFAGIRGLTSVLGLAFSVGVLGVYVVPAIVNGGDPLLVSITGALLIAVFAVYFSHGVNVRTTVAVASILITMVFAGIVSSVFVSLAGLTGLGSEEAFYLQVGMQDVNLRGLLLGGIILGALGVLDDVATAQIAAVAEIRRADPSLGFRELFVRGRRIGAENIASLVNTLALAYVGSSLPMFLLFSTQATLPPWLIANGELVAEEIVRTLAGSIALVVAVPISTALGAYVLARVPTSKLGDDEYGHRH